jgi:hypothetical protein
MVRQVSMASEGVGRLAVFFFNLDLSPGEAIRGPLGELPFRPKVSLANTHTHTDTDKQTEP